MWNVPDLLTPLTLVNCLQVSQINGRLYVVSVHGLAWLSRLSGDMQLLLDRAVVAWRACLSRRDLRNFV